MHKLEIFRYILMVEDSITELLPECLEEHHVICQQERWESSPLRLDWGKETRFHCALGDEFQCVILDEHIARHFADPDRDHLTRPLVKTRDQWSSSTLFNISTDKFLLAQDGKNKKNMYDEIWGVKSVTTASDIAPLVSCTCICLLYTSPSPRDATLSRMPSSA